MRLVLTSSLASHRRLPVFFRQPCPREPRIGFASIAECTATGALDCGGKSTKWRPLDLTMQENNYIIMSGRALEALQNEEYRARAGRKRCHYQNCSA